MKLGKFNIRVRQDHELYYKTGLGVIFRSGNLGTEYQDDRPKLFREMKLFLGKHEVILSIDWKGKR